MGDLLSQIQEWRTEASLTLPIAISMCDLYGFNHMTFCIGITLAASIACCTPLAAAQITMTQVAGYEFADYFKYCFPLTVICYIAIIVVVPFFFPILPFR